MPSDTSAELLAFKLYLNDRFEDMEVVDRCLQIASERLDLGEDLDWDAICDEVQPRTFRYQDSFSSEYDSSETEELGGDVLVFE